MQHALGLTNGLVPYEFHNGFIEWRRHHLAVARPVIPFSRRDAWAVKLQKLYTSLAGYLYRVSWVTYLVLS